MKKPLFTLAILAFFVAVSSAQTITLPKLPTATSQALHSIVPSNDCRSFIAESFMAYINFYF